MEEVRVDIFWNDVSQHQADFKVTELIIIIEDILYQYVLYQTIVLNDTSATGPYGWFSL